MDTVLQDSSDLGGSKVRIYPVTRITGRADVEVLFSSDGTVEEARFRALEYRGLDRMAVGLHAFRAPALLSRTCGSCGLFHQMASCMAVESACGTEVPQAAAWFRELLGWLWLGASHLLNVTYMALPDFALPMSDASVRNVVGIYAVEQETVRRLTTVQSAFSEALDMLAGLAVHPSVIVPGGVSYLPEWSSCTRATVLLNNCEHDLRETLRLVEELTIRNAQMAEGAAPLEGSFMATAANGLPSPTGDTVVASPFQDGEPVEMDLSGFLDSIEERPVPWSYLVPAAVGGLGPMLVGPLARANMGFNTDTPWAELEWSRMKEHWGAPLDREFHFLTALVLEVIEAWERALLLLEQRPKVLEPCVMPRLRTGEGAAVLDSPRGTMVHRLRLDEDGLVAAYRVVSPLQFNHDMLNRHLTGIARLTVEGVEISDATAQGLLLAVRAFTPCVPCGTH